MIFVATTTSIKLYDLALREGDKSDMNIKTDTSSEGGSRGRELRPNGTLMSYHTGQISQVSMATRSGQMTTFSTGDGNKCVLKHSTNSAVCSTHVVHT